MRELGGRKAYAVKDMSSANAVRKAIRDITFTLHPGVVNEITVGPEAYAILEEDLRDFVRIKIAGDEDYLVVSNYQVYVDCWLPEGLLLVDYIMPKEGI